MPARAMFLTFFVKLWEVRSHCAVRTPRSVVAIEGGAYQRPVMSWVPSDQVGWGEQAAVNPEREVMQRVHKWHAAGGDAVDEQAKNSEEYPIADENRDEERGRGAADAG